MIRGHYLMVQANSGKGVGPESFGFLVQQIARRMDTEMKAALAEVGVDLKIFANLMSLWQRDGVTQRELGRKLNFPEYFTSRNIDALVEAGFAERRPDPSSRRSYLIFLTEAGRAKGAELVPVIERVNESVLADLAEADRRTLMGLMGRVAGFARADAG